jgi:hypothetical protein
LFQAYRLFGPEEDRLGYMRRRLAERVTTSAIADLPRRDVVKTVAVLPLAGDPEGMLTRLLREKLAASGKYELLEESFFRKLLGEFGRTEEPVARLAEAVALARKLGVDAVVFGEVPEFRSSEQETAVKLELRMAERASGEAVFARAYSERMEGSRLSGSHWRARIADSSKGRRIFLWVCFALLLPLVTFPLIRRITAEESNALNFLMLAGYTLVDVLAALALTGFWIPTLWTAGILLLALAASAYYNYRIASLIDRLGR